MLLLPDPLYRTDQLSGAAFLWFRDVQVTIPPPVVTPEAADVFSRITPTTPWRSQFEVMFGGWNVLRQGHRKTMDDLVDLRDRMQVVWLSYSADMTAIARVADLIGLAGLQHEDLLDVIDVPAACGELARHLLLERWLEVDKDLDALWTICDQTFQPHMFRQRLVECYLLRLAALGTVTGFALTNPRLLDFVWRCWTVAGGPAASTEDRTLDADAVGYEIFRRLLSKYLDPLEGENATRAAVLLATKADEIEAMRRQCLRLAEKLPGVPLNRLQAEVAAYVELHVADELAAVLEMTERGAQDYLASVLSDRVVWTSMLAAIAGAADGNSGFTVAGGIGVAATLIAKGIGAKHKANTNMRDSPYRIIRTLTK
ncbi:hypothetical protein [Nocardioides sp. AN3]